MLYIAAAVLPDKVTSTVLAPAASKSNAITPLAEIEAASVVSAVPSKLIVICFSAATEEPVPVTIVAPEASTSTTVIVVSAVEVVPAAKQLLHLEHRLP